jgi:hypothetical protein
MAEMNQTQVKYARQRAQEIYGDKRKDLEDRHRTNGVQLDIKQRLKAVADCEITIEEPTAFQGPHQWSYQISFEAEAKKLKTSFNALLDELMLGDNQEALKLLKAFEAE